MKLDLMKKCKSDTKLRFLYIALVKYTIVQHETVWRMTCSKKMLIKGWKCCLDAHLSQKAWTGTRGGKMRRAAPWVAEDREPHTLGRVDKKGVNCLNRTWSHSAKMSQWAQSLLYYRCPCWVILVNMEISVILGHEKTKIQNMID